MISNFMESLLGRIIKMFLLSAMPIVELRGGIPYGAAHGISLWLNLLVCILGNIILVPFIILFIERILNWIAKKGYFHGLRTRLINRLNKKITQVQKYRFVYLGLLIFVAIPLPGTGAWTGAMIAGMMNLPVKQATAAISLGVVIAATIMSFISYNIW